MYAGQCNQFLGQYEEALAHYQIGIQKKENYHEIYYHRGLAYVSLTEFQKGIADFQKALDLCKSQERGDAQFKYKVNLNLGINLRRVGNAVESRKYLQEAANTNKPQALNNLGLTLYELGEWEEAVVQYQKAITAEEAVVGKPGEKFPGGPELKPNEKKPMKEYLSLYYNNKGLANYHAGNYDLAEEDYKLAMLAVNNSNAENFFNYGNVHLNKNEFTEAHEKFDDAIRLDGTSAKLYHAKGLAYQCQADELAKKESRNLQEESELVKKAIHQF